MKNVWFKLTYTENNEFKSESIHKVVTDDLTAYTVGIATIGEYLQNGYINVGIIPSSVSEERIIETANFYETCIAWCDETINHHDRLKSLIMSLKDSEDLIIGRAVREFIQENLESLHLLVKMKTMLDEIVPDDYWSDEE